MKHWRPVDHKDSDPVYAQRVGLHVAEKAGVRFLPEADPACLPGRWLSSIVRKRNGEFDHEFHADGTHQVPGAFHGPSPNTWQIDGDHLIFRSWCPPAPEYGIHEPMQDVTVYRCAQLTDGRFAYWNGDSSLTVFLTRIASEAGPD